MRNDKGQSLVEVLIVTAILGMMLTAIVATVVIAIGHSRDNQTRTVATQLVQEGVDWVRSSRDNLSWVEFTQTLPASGTSDYCLNSLASWPPPPTPCTTPLTININNVNYVREAQVENKGKDANNYDFYLVTIEVSWDNGAESISSTTQIGRKPS